MEKVDRRKCRKRRHPQRARDPNNPHSAAMKKWWQENGEERRRHMQEHPELYSRRGVPDGISKRSAQMYWANARRKAKQFIWIMEKNDLIPRVVLPGSEEEMAKAALEQMATICLSKTSQAKDKIAAGRILLEWCKAKPVQKTAVAIGTAEDWLKQVIDDDKHRRPISLTADTEALPE